ncbi:hypothetical protein RF11_05169 [Thelohanellus kitauei]|uniref:Uncharacterized protein n=1 Tax=Thelohanellus kitauei TaxID=669202 RepID=A0A0C2MLD9_THEKT|nr:hypothetical protein RF11_05169 [Thelohanellus kitauei]
MKASQILLLFIVIFVLATSDISGESEPELATTEEKHKQNVLDELPDLGEELERYWVELEKNNKGELGGIKMELMKHKVELEGHRGELERHKEELKRHKEELERHREKLGLPPEQKE